MKTTNISRSKKTGKISEAMIQDARAEAAITCKIVEYQELEGIEAEIAGELTNKYAYEYTDKDGNVVRGIRAVGVREAIRFTKAKLYNFIPKFTYEREDLGDGWFREVVTCTNPKTKEQTRSSCQWRRGDRFGDRTAATNAERNAMLKQLPAELKLLFINYCVKKGYIKRVDVTPSLPENKKAVETLGNGNVAQVEADKQKTVAITRIYAITASIGCNKDKMRAWLHKSYKAASLKDLGAEVLNKIGKGLSDIYNNAPGRCAKPTSNIMICDEFKAMIDALQLNDKGEIPNGK